MCSVLAALSAAGAARSFDLASPSAVSPRRVHAHEGAPISGPSRRPHSGGRHTRAAAAHRERDRDFDRCARAPVVSEIRGSSARTQRGAAHLLLRRGAGPGLGSAPGRHGSARKAVDDAHRRPPRPPRPRTLCEVKQWPGRTNPQRNACLCSRTVVSTCLVSRLDTPGGVAFDLRLSAFETMAASSATASRAAASPAAHASQFLKLLRAKTASKGGNSVQPHPPPHARARARASERLKAPRVPGGAAAAAGAPSGASLSLTMQSSASEPDLGEAPRSTPARARPS
jgi:hypothetical protein